MSSQSDICFTGKELGRLNQRHNAHVAYAGKVYNASGFLAKHPGGCDQLMLGAGRDITQLFQSHHILYHTIHPNLAVQLGSGVWCGNWH